MIHKDNKYDKLAQVSSARARGTTTPWINGIILHTAAISKYLDPLNAPSLALNGSSIKSSIKGANLLGSRSALAVAIQVPQSSTVSTVTLAIPVLKMGFNFSHKASCFENVQSMISRRYNCWDLMVTIH
ncbi:hypothetical protein E2C01_029392 [Portunus trituberculatus]|uniref:Uncharacterized protein n=1 Tax=Portunus trituberculatus TaxID=210409 RepID=A0A5B7EP45_PORTR|nr:hypothetical protein [Portunus trituberculatus]